MTKKVIKGTTHLIVSERDWEGKSVKGALLCIFIMVNCCFGESVGL